MIPAKKSALFSRWFSWDAERRLSRAFARVAVRGLPALRSAIARGPVLGGSNHTAWWDALVVLFLCERVLGADAYAMMDAANLRELPFFGRVGAFGVDLSDKADGARAMRYAAKLLDRPGRVVWLFAQGREVPVTARPLDFRGGSAEIARVARACEIIPAALRYEHGATEKPSALVSFGTPLARDRDVARGRAAHEAAVCGELDAIDRALIGGDLGAFYPLLERRPDRLFAFFTRSLAALMR